MELYPGKPARCLGDCGHPDGVVIAPGHDARPRWGAECSRVHVRIAEPGLGQAIEDRGVDQSAEAGELAIANIVEHDDHDVGSPLTGSGWRWPGRT